MRYHIDPVLEIIEGVGEALGQGVVWGIDLAGDKIRDVVELIGQGIDRILPFRRGGVVLKTNTRRAAKIHSPGRTGTTRPISAGQGQGLTRGQQLIQELKAKPAPKMAQSQGRGLKM